MKLVVVLVALFSSAAIAGVTVVSTVDLGGQHTTGGSYTMEGSLGQIAGSQVAGSQPEMVKAGYLGQLTDVVSLSLTGAPLLVNEGYASQLAGFAVLDDNSVLSLAGSDIAWGSVSYPFQSVNGNGLLTAVPNVYAAAAGNVSGSYLGATSSVTLQVLGPYAGSGIPDSWFYQYFGAAPNPNAAPLADADGTGQNNLFKYNAGLDPTNPASIFELWLTPVSGQPNQVSLMWNPWTTGRSYTVEYSTNLLDGSYTTLLSSGDPQTNGNRISVTDLNVTERSKFYRIRVAFP